MENARFHDRYRKEALWSEIAKELNLTVIDVKRWFESQRTRYGKLSKQQFGQAPRELTRRQSWVYEQIRLVKSHIRRKGANRSLGFNTSTMMHDKSRGSTLIGIVKSAVSVQARLLCHCSHLHLCLQIQGLLKI